MLNYSKAKYQLMVGKVANRIKAGDPLWKVAADLKLKLEDARELDVLDLEGRAKMGDNDFIEARYQYEIKVEEKKLAALKENLKALKEAMSENKGRVTFRDRKDAEDVLWAMKQLQCTYGKVTLMDLKDLSGIDSRYNDAHKYWSSVEGSIILRDNEGYYEIVIPRMLHDDRGDKK